MIPYPKGFPAERCKKSRLVFLSSADWGPGELGASHFSMMPMGDLHRTRRSIGIDQSVAIECLIASDQIVFGERTGKFLCRAARQVSAHGGGS